MPTNSGLIFYLLPRCWLSFLSPKIRLSEPFEAWTIVWMSEIRRFLGLRECSPLLFSIVLFQIFGDSSVSGSALVALGHIALLEGVCWNIGKLCEHAQCARSSDSRYILHLDCFPGYFSIIPFYFVVYSIYTRPCNVVTYPFASVPPQRQPEIYSL
ncbi:hypothetical protein K443DRAFT_643422, partial [Laccaria amethystina LaAM-08-1]